MTRSGRIPNSSRRAGAHAPSNPPVASPDKATRLVAAAARLTYEHGFHRTSLADIAREAAVPLGNVYYYFKTKEEIGEAVVAALSASFDEKRNEWARLADPRARLRAFIDFTVDRRAAVAKSGCPVGTLCSELNKEQVPLAQHASQIFAASLHWMEEQFAAMGRRDAAGLAVHLLSALEGVSLLTHAFGDERYMVQEATRLKDWIRQL